MVLDIKTDIMKALFKHLIYFIIISIRFFIFLIERIQFFGKSFQDNETINSIDISYKNLLVESENGYLKIEKIHLCDKEKEYRIIFDDCYIGCADYHPIILSNGTEIKARDIKVGDLIKTKYGIKPVLSIKHLPFKLCMMDITIESPHIYYANNILVHNCVTFDTMVDIYDDDKKQQIKIPIFEAHYQYKQKLDIFDKIILKIYRIMFKLKTKI